MSGAQNGNLEPTEVLEEDEAPAGSGLENVFESKTPAPTHDQATRKMIALIILGMLGLFYLLILLGFLFGGVDVDGLHAASASISGIQALAAAAVGFYYGANKK